MRVAVRDGRLAVSVRRRQSTLELATLWSEVISLDDPIPTVNLTGNCKARCIAKRPSQPGPGCEERFCGLENPDRTAPAIVVLPTSGGDAFYREDGECGRVVPASISALNGCKTDYPEVIPITSV